MPEGKEVGKAYVTVHLDDHTDAEYQKMRSDLEAKPPVKIPASVAKPDAKEVDKARAETEAQPPVKIPAKIDVPKIVEAVDKARVEAEALRPVEIPTSYKFPKGDMYAGVAGKIDAMAAPLEVPVTARNPIDEAWRAKVQASIKSIAADALNIPMTPDTQKFRSELIADIADVSAQIKLPLDADLAHADKFKLQVEELAREVSAEVKAKIPVEINQGELKAALASLETSVDTSAKKAAAGIPAAFTGVAAGITAAIGVLAGPGVALGLGAIAGGFAAIGVMAEKSAPQVGAAFNTMKVTGTDVLQASFQSLTPVIVTSLNQATNAVTRLGPEFAKISAEIAPGFSILTGAILQGAQIAIPAMTSALSQATPMARALAGGINDVAVGFSQFLGRLDFSQASQGLGSLLGAVGQLMPVLASVVNAVMPLGNAILSGVLPPVLTLIGGLANGLAPAIQVVAGAINMLSPLLNFMAGPTAAILIGVAAMKGFEAVATGLLPVFNTLSAGVSTYGSRLIGMVSSNDAAIGSTTLMTTAQQKAAVSSATAALASAQQAAATAASNLVTLESAAAADAAAVSQEQLAAARIAATVTAEAETAATVAVNRATTATTFALGPVGIGLGVVAGLMALFAGNTTSAAPPVQNFTAELHKLAEAAPGAAQGMLAANPQLTEMVNKASAAGVSVKDLSAALDGGAAAQKSVTATIQGTADALGAQKSGMVGLSGMGSDMQKSSVSVKELSASIDSNKLSLSSLPQPMQEMITKYRDAQKLLKDLGVMYGQNADTQRAAASVGAQSVQLTAEQQSAATGIAKLFGMSIQDVVAAFAKLPGAGSTAAGSVMQLSSGFLSAMIPMKNAEQGIADYFTSLQKNADQANQALSSANHSYQQSIQAVADAQHSFTQSQMAVETANKGVETAMRSVTDAVHSYEQAQHSVAQANQGVIDAENGVAAAEQNLAKAQVSETQAQLTLTLAREAAGQQLKSLSLQLNDQIVSEQRAQMHLFDQLRLSASRRVTPDNAADILSQPTTTANEAMKLSALDLVSAQNALADSLNAGAVLRDKVNDANRLGVDGAPAVVSAEQALQNAHQQVASSLSAVEKAHRAVDNAVYSLQQSYYALGKAQQGIVDAQAGVVKAQQAVRDAVYAEEKARIAVKDAIYNQLQASNAIRTAQEAASRANDLNTYSLDLNTQAGRNNYAQLQSLFASYPAWMTDQQRWKQSVDDTAWAFHMSRENAIQFLESTNRIPKNFDYSVNAMATVNTSQLDQVFRSITSGGYYNNSMNQRRAVGATGLAEGGHVTGPGGPKDDVIPAMLSAGEFVQPADVVSHYGVGWMDALRKKKIPKGYAMGGLVSDNYVGAALGATYTADVNALEVMGFPHPPSLPKYVEPPAFSGSYGGGPNGAIPTGAHLAMIDAALAADGIARADWPRWEAGMDVLIQRESSWNPNSINTWDSNAAAGHPSGGLTQTIASTYAGNRNPSLVNDMFDPVSNIAASINYIVRTYGDISNVQQANPNMPHKGYAAGGLVTPGSYDNGGFMLDKPALNSTGKPEMILPPDLTNTLMSLHKMVQGGQTGSSSKPSVSMPINITTVPMDPHETAGAVSTAVMWELRR